MRRLALLALILPAPALAAAPPPAVAELIRTALATGDATKITAVVDVAKLAHPDSAGEIDLIVAGSASAAVTPIAAAPVPETAAQTRQAAVTPPSTPWKGDVEIGGSRATGNNEALGLYASVALRQEGPVWRHGLNARADIQTSFGATSTQRASVAWQPGYRIDDRLYAYGLAQYEHDRFLGYASRYTGGAGLGYAVVKRDRLTIDLEGGPAIRRTAFVDDSANTTLAGRASLAVKWQISPTLKLAQDAALFYEPGNSNAIATTALDTRLIGPLTARFSYNLQYERDAPPGRDPVDTLSRATLVYGF